jgi:hypothetical protein
MKSSSVSFEIFPRDKMTAFCAFLQHKLMSSRTAFAAQIHGGGSTKRFQCSFPAILAIRSLAATRIVSRILKEVIAAVFLTGERDPKSSLELTSSGKGKQQLFFLL